MSSRDVVTPCQVVRRNLASSGEKVPNTFTRLKSQVRVLQRPRIVVANTTLGLSLTAMDWLRNDDVVPSKRTHLNRPGFSGQGLH